jgi:hypothetical protein
MIVVMSATRYDNIVCRCVSRPDDVPPRGEPSGGDYRQRFKVERSFAWLGNFRRLLIRWEHRVDLYRNFFVTALLLICVRRASSL